MLEVNIVDNIKLFYEENNYMRVLIQSPPFIGYSENNSWHLRGLWRYRWISVKDIGETPFVVAYRKKFFLNQRETIRVHVSADERYELFIDGCYFGRGSEYGSIDNWYYETYDMTLEKGYHVIVAKVWSLGDMAPHAQISLCHGFIFAPDKMLWDCIGTGTSEWEFKKIDGIEFVLLTSGYLTPYWGTGANVVIHANKFPWGFEKGEGDGWKPVKVLHEGTNGNHRNGAFPSHLMRPSELPSQIDQEIKTGIVRYVSKSIDFDLTKTPIHDFDNVKNEMSSWDLLGNEKFVTIPPKSSRRVIYDLGNYYCAYPSFVITGGRGSRIELQWAESLFNEPQALTKGNRDQIEGKYFLGVGDVFLPDGGQNRNFETLWFQAGRYLQLLVQTADESLTIERFRLRETRYPLEMESYFISDEDRLSSLIQVALRGLQMCAHEIYFDCPYYEQLMYSGDTRLQSLATFLISHDDRLPRKAIETFDKSRLSMGLTRSTFPARCLQIIPSFSLAWIGMVYDYALWRGDREFIKKRMPGVRNVLDALMSFRNDDGLLECLPGWNFIDWVPNWVDGVPPTAESRPCGIINWYMVYALNLAARLEEWMNEPELKGRWNRFADEIAQNISEVFWDSKRGLFADDPEQSYISEHAQCLAVLSGKLDENKLNTIRQTLLNEKDLAKTTISFSHYLFEAYRELGLIDAFFKRLELWFDLESNGFKTTPEWPEPTRSDCHGWGSHPIYHCFATLLGIRPDSMGFRTVEVRPQSGHLKYINTKMVHPSGWIDVDLTFKNNCLSGSIRLPHNIHGNLRYNNKDIPLYGGVEQIIDC